VASCFAERPLWYGHANVPEVAPFGGWQETLDFAAIHRHLAVTTEKKGNLREWYAVAFHRRNVDSTSCVYTKDEDFVVRLFDKAKSTRAAKAGDATWEKLWADNPRILPRKQDRPR
jgi:hypothetical protein